MTKITRDHELTIADHLRDPLGVGKLEKNTKRTLETIL